MAFETRTLFDEENGPAFWRVFLLEQKMKFTDLTADDVNNYRRYFSNVSNSELVDFLTHIEAMQNRIDAVDLVARKEIRDRAKDTGGDFSVMLGSKGDAATIDFREKNIQEAVQIEWTDQRSSP